MSVFTSLRIWNDSFDPKGLLLHWAKLEKLLALIIYLEKYNKGFFLLLLKSHLVAYILKYLATDILNSEKKSMKKK